MFPAKINFQAYSNCQQQARAQMSWSIFENFTALLNCLDKCFALKDLKNLYSYPNSTVKYMFANNYRSLG